jgi:hypothetical protein
VHKQNTNAERILTRRREGTSWLKMRLKEETRKQRV